VSNARTTVPSLAVMRALKPPPPAPPTH
jgi:hypothetical protein